MREAPGMLPLLLGEKKNRTRDGFWDLSKTHREKHSGIGQTRVDARDEKLQVE